MPRKTSRRVRTRLRKIDSDSETLHLEKELELAHARQDLQRSCSVDALDEIGDDGGRRLRTKRASTEVGMKLLVGGGGGGGFLRGDCGEITSVFQL